jgi:hydrogenase maturation protease
MAAARVLCLGNPWHGNDGFGHHVFLRLQAEHALPQGVELVDAGLAGLNALRRLDGCAKAVLVDAVRVGARIGTLHRLAASDLEPPGDEFSLHELGLASLLAAHAAAGDGAEVIVIGAEVGPIRTFTDALSPPVRAAVPTAAAMVTREVATLSRPAVPTRPHDRPPPYASGTGAS